MNTRRLPQWTTQMEQDGLHLEFKHLRIERTYIYDDAFKGHWGDGDLVERNGSVQPTGGRTIAYLCAGNPLKNGKVLASAHFNFNKHRNYDKRIGRLAAGGKVLRAYYHDGR